MTVSDRIATGILNFFGADAPLDYGNLLETETHFNESQVSSAWNILGGKSSWHGRHHRRAQLTRTFGYG